jgi:hypothetical protein
VRLFATATPTVLWLSHVAVLALTGSLCWPPIIWVGVVMSGRPSASEDMPPTPLLDSVARQVG